MANLNDFKIVKLKSKKMFNYIEVDNNLGISDLQTERYGFYHLILENITGVIDSNNDTYTIIDSDYNKVLHNIGIDDYGMDAISLLENENGEIDIRLFNFKYRENFNEDKTKSEGDISRSTKFLEYIVANQKLDETVNKLVHESINSIIEQLNSNKICNIYLYMVSNEANGFAQSTNKYISILEKNYGMKIVNISLDDISAFFNERKDNRKSSFMISDTEFLSFQSDEKSTQKSYILKLSLLDLIRISSINEDLANNYSLENDNEILETKLDFSLLYDNVRGYLGETKYNKNIIKTLKDNHNYFFMFNNGITLTAETIECEPKNSGIKYLFKIGDFQIVNGGQTVRSIYNFLNENNDINKITKLREAFVLLRIFKTNKGDSLQNSIAEYTNSQNAISDVDLKSIDSIQIQIEKYFSELGILYSRKAGDLGINKKDYQSRISMEKMAQILYSIMGYPDRASNQKRRLFQDYYDEIFKSDKFSLEKCKACLEKYISVENLYKNSNYKVSDQKVFYIIYIIEFTNKKVEEAIQKLEELLKQYPAEVAEARKLIQKGFKDFVDEDLGIKE